MFTPERILLMIFGLTFAVGAADYFCGGKLKLGKKFVEGLQTFAPLFLTMAGFLVLSPWLAKVLAPAASAALSGAGVADQNTAVFCQNHGAVVAFRHNFCTFYGFGGQVGSRSGAGQRSYSNHRIHRHYARRSLCIYRTIEFAPEKNPCCRKEPQRVQRSKHNRFYHHHCQRHTHHDQLEKYDSQRQNAQLCISLLRGLRVGRPSGVLQCHCKSSDIPHADNQIRRSNIRHNISGGLLAGKLTAVALAKVENLLVPCCKTVDVVCQQLTRRHAAKGGQPRERMGRQFAGYIPANRAEMFREADRS